MPSLPFTAAASMLLAGLLDGPPVRLREEARTRVSVHYGTPDPRVPVLCVCLPAAVRLPASLVTTTLPGPGPLQVGLGGLAGEQLRWRITRWWRPARPERLPRPDLGPARLAELEPPAVEGPAAYDALVVAELLGAGEGLTPSGDDVLAGALVTARAVGDPRLAAWQQETDRLLTPGRTTAVSRGMLSSALDGYATDQLAEFLQALCRGADPDTVRQARARLLALGHSSGAATLRGVLHTLTTNQLEGAA